MVVKIGTLLAIGNDSMFKSHREATCRLGVGDETLEGVFVINWENGGA